jgi:hypothetical protein
MLDNDKVKQLIIRVFGTDEGKLLLEHLYQKNVNTTIATTPCLLEIGKRQGKADLIRAIKDLMENTDG